MNDKDDSKTKDELLRAYKRVRKAAAPPEKVIPDKRRKKREAVDEEEIRDARG